MLLHFFFSCSETVYIVWRLSVPSKFERMIKLWVSPSSEGEISATSQFLYIPLKSAWEPNPAVGQELAEMWVCQSVMDASSHLTDITNSPLESGACLKLKLSIWYLLNSRAESWLVHSCIAGLASGHQRCLMYARIWFEISCHVINIKKWGWLWVGQALIPLHCNWLGFTKKNSEIVNSLIGLDWYFLTNPLAVCGVGTGVFWLWIHCS